MKRWYVWMLTVGVALPAAAAEPLWEAPDTDAELSAAVVGRNIFLADRAGLDAAARAAQAPSAVAQAGSVVPSAPATPPPPPVDPDASRVLVGVVVVDGKPTAFIEDRSAGRIDRVTEPGAFGAGRITAITLMGLTYAVGDAEPRTIGLRQTLAGAAATSGATSEAAAMSAADQGDGATAAPDASTLSALERMRLRRAQELAPPPPATTSPAPSAEPLP